MNEDVTRVHCATSLDTRTSGALITLAATPLRLGAASAGVTFDTAFPRAENSLPNLPWRRLRPGRGSAMQSFASCKEIRMCFADDVMGRRLAKVPQ
jgi:hypothetical protein